MSSMQVFVSEYVCGGAWPESVIATSLAAEGRAMLLAVLTDLARLPEVEVVSTWDSRLPIEHIDGVEFTRISSRGQEREVFANLASNADAVVLIAPETDGVLADRVEVLESLQVNHMGCDSWACRLLGDKLATFEFLTNAGIPTVPTRELQREFPFEFPVVVKPKDGAGCVDTWRFESSRQFAEASPRFADRREAFVVQPWIDGPSASVAVIIASGQRVGDACESAGLVLPVAHQAVLGTGELSYSGGSVPMPLDEETVHEIQQVAGDVCTSLSPHLRGYIGIDLILSENGPRIVDINPRLTTSYLGYRQLTKSNLAAWITGRCGIEPPNWEAGPVDFKPDFVGS